jgi:hypothetical protein
MAGCPQDLSLQRVPGRRCSRTVLGKAEIVLLRTGEDAVPGRMLAVVFALCFDASGRSCRGCGELIAVSIG